MWADTREVLQLTRVERDPGKLRWSPDGNVHRLRDEPARRDAGPAGEAAADAQGRAAREGRRHCRPHDLGRRRHRARPPRASTRCSSSTRSSGGTPRQVTSGDYNHGAPAWSADGKTHLRVRHPQARCRVPARRFRDLRVDLATLEVKAADRPRAARTRSPSVSPDGKWIAYTGYRPAELHQPSDQPLPDGRPAEANKRLWAGNLPSSPADVAWAPDGSGRLLLDGGARRSQRLLRSHLACGRRRAKSRRGTHVLAARLDRRATARPRPSAPRRRSPGVLVTFTLAKPAEMKVLVDVNATCSTASRSPTPRSCGSRRATALKVQGWLMKPANFDPAKKYPLRAVDPRRPVEHVQRRLELGAGRTSRPTATPCCGPTRAARPATARTSSTASSTATRARTTTT